MSSHAQKVSSISEEKLASLLEQDNDTLYVINFWATWCSPCVTEIGYFEELHIAFKNQKLKVILINLDFPNQIEKRVLPFINEKNLTAEVLNMTNMDYNSWIPIVDPDWSGAIPATLIFKSNSKKFISRELSKKELFDEVYKILKI
jgi:thiol-disulfide isomerase/thioredoxin